MKKALLIAGLATALWTAAPEAQANGRSPHAREYYDHAKVIDVRPVYHRVRVATPQRECWDEQVTHYDGGRSDSYTGVIVGGIVGGVVGNQFGRGRGKDAATIAGTLLGASIAHDLGRAPAQPYTTVRQHCRVVDHYQEHERLVGYDVSYRYRGELYTTRMDRDPGRRVRVHVTEFPARYSVRPAL
jgi:uncharacterized protein YcfJ